MHNGNLLTTAQVADELHLDRSVINKWVKAGKIKPKFEGKGIRGPRFFTRAEVERVRALRGSAG